MLLGPVVVVLGALGALVLDVARDGAGLLTWRYLTGDLSSSPDRAGVWAGVVGSVLLVLVCVAVVLPLGIATAVYLEEYADRRRLWVRLLEANLQNLASVPSIVYGILGLALVVRGPLALGTVLLAGGLTLALLVLPLVVVTARDALRAVPPSQREAAYALGATRWQVTCRVALPGAVPGIATGLVLAVAEALGQAAPLLVVGAVSFMLYDPALLGDYTALPILIYDWTGRPQDEWQANAAAAILVLLGLLLALNAVVVWVRARFERRW
jgi:phosphate transport system permease protein